MAEAVLEVRGVRKRFGAVVASDGISLCLREGEIHALIGPNGAGKSTLISQIVGTVRPDAGRILFCGVDVSDRSAAERARAGLARTFQISAFAPELTVQDHVLLALAGRDRTVFRRFGIGTWSAREREEAKAELQRVGLAEFRDLPAGALAHGQRRLLDIAVALALRPRAVLLDEPMAGLGSEGVRELTGLLGRLRAEVPILLVEHDMDVVFALADRITVLVYGRVIASGPPAAIRGDRSVRNAYLGEAFR